MQGSGGRVVGERYLLLAQVPGHVLGGDVVPDVAAAPVANKGSPTQYAGRILRTHEDKTTAEVHDYLDQRTGVLAAMLAKRAPGYTGLGFPDPRRLALTPSASTERDEDDLK